eukprot:Polyplicarium_translucidae@DN73_c0_g1_i1.p2
MIACVHAHAETRRRKIERLECLVIGVPSGCDRCGVPNRDSVADNGSFRSATRLDEGKVAVPCPQIAVPMSQSLSRPDVPIALPSRCPNRSPVPMSQSLSRPDVPIAL